MQELVEVSTYFTHERETLTDKVRKVVRFCKEKVLGFSIGCDTNVQGEVLLDFLMEWNPFILNLEAETTFITARRRGVLDERHLSLLDYDKQRKGL